MGGDIIVWTDNAFALAGMDAINSDHDSTKNKLLYRDILEHIPDMVKRENRYRPWVSFKKIYSHWDEINICTDIHKKQKLIKKLNKTRIKIRAGIIPFTNYE